MRNQSKYFLLYLCVLCMLIGGAIQLAQAQEANTVEQNAERQEQAEVLNQAELDQMLAPIALYPDTLLSHILVASTYPLEVVQAARWRLKNETLDEQEALKTAEDKDWDPSVKALVPFNDLLQKFSQDLDWLQALGDAFLLNEEQVLTSVQGLRQKAYAQGNLQDNEYLDVDQDEGQIVIETVEKEVVHVPYYDTRVVYGNWWWGAYPPHYWHRPSHYVWRAGFYWSPGFYIRPSFYFGGFHWRNRHLVANYHYRNTSHRNWRHHNGHNRRQTVRVRDYPRWSHNNTHRRGVRYQHSQNANRYVGRNKAYHGKKQHQIDKQRVLNVEHLKNKGQSQQVKQRLAANKQVHKRSSAHKEQSAKAQQGSNLQVHTAQSSGKKVYRSSNNHKQRLINKANGEQRSKVVKQAKGERAKNQRKVQQQSSSVKAQKPHSANKPQRYVQKKGSHNNKYRAKSNERQVKSQRRSSSNHNKSRPVNTSRSRQKQSRH